MVVSVGYGARVGVSDTSRVGMARVEETKRARRKSGVTKEENIVADVC